MDTADTLSFDGGDLDVSLVSPGSTPGVSDEIIILSVLGSISDGSNCVVELGSAEGGVQNTGFVLLEDGFVGLNGHGHWLLGNGGLELGNRLGWDGLVGLDTDLSGVLGSLASSGSSGVGVVVFEVLGLLLSVDEGVGLPSTVASIGLGVAVNELLLGEGEELSGGNEVGTFDGSSGGESPA